MAVTRIVVLCAVLLCLLAVTQARRGGFRGRGRGRGGTASARFPRGPICKITNASGVTLYEDTEICVLNSACLQVPDATLTCANDVQASLWMCQPKLMFLRGACVINGRDVGRNCSCDATVYTISASGSSSVSVRYCQHGDDDESDHHGSAGERDWPRRALLGQYFNDFDISTCQRPGMAGGRRGGRYNRRQNGRQGRRG